MSAEGTVPSARPRPRGRVTAVRLTWVMAALAAVVTAGTGTAACDGGAPAHVVVSRPAPGGANVAAVRLTRCGADWCESLWLGPNEDSATLVATLPHASERAGEIAWAKDGSRVGFLINGYQLRIYDAATRRPAGQVELIVPDGPPTTRIARGVTVSDNGAAVTFDDCPRDRSGCRPGLTALR